MSKVFNGVLKVSESGLGFTLKREQELTGFGKSLIVQMKENEEQAF